jgi:hypothetical protein
VFSAYNTILPPLLFQEKEKRANLLPPLFDGGILWRIFTQKGDVLAGN